MSPNPARHPHVHLFLERIFSFSLLSTQDSALTTSTMVSSFAAPAARVGAASLRVPHPAHPSASTCALPRIPVLCSPRSARFLPPCPPSHEDPRRYGAHRSGSARGTLPRIAAPAATRRSRRWPLR